jgi:hypothetical protein
MPAPRWCDELPEPYRKVFFALSFDEVAGWVTDPLGTAGITDYNLWWMDVPEFLRTPYELYVRLGGNQTSDAPEYRVVEPKLTKIVEQYSTPHGVVLRHQRLLWQSGLIV